MKGFKSPDFADRQRAAEAARKAALDKFRTRPAADDPEVAAREKARLDAAKAREQREAERKAAKEAAAREKAEAEARAAAEAAEQARLAAEAAVREKEERKQAQAAAEAEQKAARDARYAARKARKK
jgi:hypothetical protein